MQVEPERRIEALHERHCSGAWAWLALGLRGAFVVARDRADQHPAHAGAGVAVIRAQEAHAVGQRQHPLPDWHGRQDSTNLPALTPSFSGFEFHAQSITFDNNGLGATTRVSSGLRCKVGLQ